MQAIRNLAFVFESIPISILVSVVVAIYKPSLLNERQMTLRPYQVEAKKQIEKLFASGVRRVLLQMPTGAGKTAVFCEFLKELYEQGKSAGMVVRGVNLIEQASARLHREGVSHGIIQGNNSKATHLPIQVCSVNTLHRRGIAPKFDFLVIDEAHLTGGHGYKWLLDQYTECPILAVSATPHLARGMRHIADEIIHPVTVTELIEMGFLVPGRYFACGTPDLSSVKTVNGDYHEGQLAKVMKKAALDGNPAEHYLRLAKGRPALMFAVTVDHSLQLVRQFNEAGVKTEHLDADFNLEEREKAVKRLVTGETEVISSVGIMTTGFDCPPVSCIILCRPTRTRNLHIQMLGRGTRPFDGKQDFLVLDHAGNIREHGFIEDDYTANINPPKKKRGERPYAGPPTTTCAKCYRVYYMALTRCPTCGHPNPIKVPKNDEKKELEEIIDNREPWERMTENLITTARNNGLKKGWIYFKLKERFTPEIADMAWKKKVQHLKVWPLKEQLMQSTMPDISDLPP